MIIDIDTLRERNCANCKFRNEKYKILACKLRNKQVRRGYCCHLHEFDGEGGKDGE